MLRLLIGLAVVMGPFAMLAFAASNRYAVVTINNNTRDLTFNFEYRWGNGKWRAVKELKPGRALWFSIELDANGQAPGYPLRLNRAIGKAKPVIKTFDLQGRAAPQAAASFGKQYEIRRDLLDRTTVWVFESGR